MGCLLYCLLVWSTLYVYVHAELPTKLDDFMGKLFEHEECEEFISGDFNAVATNDCSPFICAFPMQICMRPAAKFTDKTTNICRDIPSQCLTAANDGVPVGPPKLPVITPPPLILTLPHVDKTPKGNLGGTGGPVINRPPPPITQDICQMGPPEGRFCGFKIMHTYNKETFECDEFWFPGCRTAETNANLFDDYQSCFKVAQMCKPTTAAPTTTRPFIIPTPRPIPIPPPPPPVQPPPPVPAAGGLGGLAGLGGFLGSGTGPGPGQPLPTEGNGEDMNLFGFIKQGLDSAQKIQKGGAGGKQAAAQAATNILQQFTGFDFNNVQGSLGNFGGFFG